MLRKLLLPALIATVFNGVVSNAYVVEQTQTDGTMKLSYPLVYETNPTVQYNINTDIASYVTSEKAVYEAGTAKVVKLSYQVAYEDDNYLSIILTPYHYYGGAHGHYKQIGRVYDKHTGDVLPLSYFVHINSAEQLTEGLRNHSVKLYSQTRQIPMTLDGLWKDVPYVSDSYYLAGNGFIELIYQPYELGPYSVGATRIEISPTAAANFNKLNQ